MSAQNTQNGPTCATYDQYVASQLMKEFIASNLPSAEKQQDLFVSSTLPRRAGTTASLSSNGLGRLGATIVTTAAATHSNVTKCCNTKKLMAVKYAKRTTNIAVLSQKIKTLKYEILLLEEMEMLLQERMQYVQEVASRESYEDGVCG